MKYRMFLGFAIFIVLAFGAFVYVAWPYRGLAPNILPPPVDLGEATPITSSTSTDEEIQPGKNETGLPLNLPEGFSMNVFARGLGNPRVIQFDPKGVLFVSTPEQGKILATPDENKDGVADTTKTILQGLERPHGFDFDGQHDGTLFVAEADMLTKYRYLASSNSATDRKELYALPSGGRHWTKTLMYEPSLGFGSHAVRISIGSSCDVCHESDKRRATVLALELGETRDETILLEESTGLRNSVFMTRGPDGKIWATEMGRDFLGDELPPDEINIIEDDKNYGWPICYGKNIHDTVFDKNTYIRNPCMEPFETPSKIDLPAHSAPLGLAFVPAGKGWPKEYEGNLLVAYHGSWNRSEPTGYKVRRFILDDKGDVVKDEDFISGWLDKKGVLGRPVDLKFDNNGVLFISDDRAGLIYRVTPPKR